MWNHMVLKKAFRVKWNDTVLESEKQGKRSVCVCVCVCVRVLRLSHNVYLKFIWKL